MVERTTYRRYEEWKGKNHFFFDGTFMLGSDAKFFVITNILTLIPSLLFFFFVVPGLENSEGILAALVTLLLIALVNLWQAAFFEPGIIPRIPKHETPERPPAGSPMGENGWKLCETCNVYRPPRAKHCTFCDNCVEELGMNSTIKTNDHIIIYTCILGILRSPLSMDRKLYREEKLQIFHPLFDRGDCLRRRHHRVWVYFHVRRRPSR